MIPVGMATMVKWTYMVKFQFHEPDKMIFYSPNKYNLWFDVYDNLMMNYSSVMIFYVGFENQWNE